MQLRMAYPTTEKKNPLDDVFRSLCKNGPAEARAENTARWFGSDVALRGNTPLWTERQTPLDKFTANPSFSGNEHGPAGVILV